MFVCTVNKSSSISEMNAAAYAYDFSKTGDYMLKPHSLNNLCARQASKPPRIGAATGIQPYSQSDEPLPLIGAIA